MCYIYTNNQHPLMCERASDENPIIAGATLSATYQTSGATCVTAEVRSDDELTLLVKYVEGSAETGNVCEVEVSFSPDGTNWAIYGVWSDGGSGQMAYTQQFFNVPQSTNALIALDGVLARWIRIRLKEEGVASNAGTASVWLYRNKK